MNQTQTNHESEKVSELDQEVFQLWSLLLITPACSNLLPASPRFNHRSFPV
jgi:hypothetical protein